MSGKLCSLAISLKNKKQERRRVYSKKQGIYIGKLDVYVYCHCWEHSRTISCKIIKILCLSVLNGDNMVVHQICKYKYYHPCRKRWAYSYLYPNIENNNKNN